MSEIKLLNRENMNEYISNIKKEYPNAKFYSHSRLGTFNQCKRSYYYTYIDKKIQRPSCYSILGSVAHETLEDLYEGRVDVLDKNKFDNEFLKCELFGIEFPKSKYDIKGGYKKDINAFYDIYKRIDKNKKVYSEIGFVLKVDGFEDRFELGYIDALIINEDNTCSIVDFKTSSLYDKEHEISASNQLILYSQAIEQLYGIKVKDVSWHFLKYVDVKIGDNKPRTALRGREWVKKCEIQIKKLMKAKGYNDLMIELFLSKAILDNSINGLPEDIKSEINANIHIRYYDIKDKDINRFKEYTKNTILEIENMESSLDDWQKEPDKFFCMNLCGFYPKNCDGDLKLIK